ncbi:MAG: TolC family protein [Armatimonadetes bacterium]|nr:TolC family protein [Armatimonadota bacterium]
MNTNLHELAGVCIKVRTIGILVMSLFFCVEYSEAQPTPPQVPLVKMTLSQCIALALKENPSLGNAVQKTAEARAQVDEARASARPKGTITYEHSQVYTADIREPSIYAVPGRPNEYSIAPYDSSSLGLNLTYPLYSGGKIEAGKDQALANLRRTEEEYGELRMDVALDVTTGFFASLRSRRLDEVAQEACRLNEAQLDRARKFFEAGSVPKADVLRAEAQLAQARENLIRAHNARILADSQLRYSMGTPPTEPLDLVEQSEYPFPHVLGEPAALVIRALHFRPRIRQMESLIAGAKALLRSARSGRLPSVSLLGSWSDQLQQSQYLSSLRDLAVTLQSSFPFYDGGAAAAKMRQAEAQVAQAEVQLAQAQKQVALEVQKAYLAVKDAKERVASAAVSLTQARENLRVAEVRYEAGIAPIMEVMDARLLFTQASISSVQATYDVHVASAQLLRAIGEAYY